MGKKTILQKLIDAKIIILEDTEYIGMTKDGPVYLGHVSDENNIEKYLADHPTSETW